MSANIFTVIDLMFGDSGKGAHVDYLCREHPVHTVVRFNGGSQAGHNVHTSDGKHHCFHQFGSGTLANNSDTFLSEYVLVDIWRMNKEAEDLKLLGVDDPMSRMYIHEDCPIVTPWHIAANRIKEILRNNRHGSCGLGIGETAFDLTRFSEDEILRVKDLNSPYLLHKKIRHLYDVRRAEILDEIDIMSGQEKETGLTTYFDDSRWVEWFVNYLIQSRPNLNIVNDSFFTERLERDGTIVFEGAQGVLLDEDYGFHPYTTWSHTTTHNIQKLLEKHKATNQIYNYGLIRAYGTRHGAGPFSTECAMPDACYEDDNIINDWQDHFRVGTLDVGLVRYAIVANNMSVDYDPNFEINGLVVSCVDKLLDQASYAINTTNVDHYFSVQVNDLVKRTEVSKKLLYTEPLNTEWYANPAWIKQPVTPGLILNTISQKLTGIDINYYSVSPTAEGRFRYVFHNNFYEKKKGGNIMGAVDENLPDEEELETTPAVEDAAAAEGATDAEPAE